VSERGLEPLLVLDFAERVEDWDFDVALRRLAVTYYPSNTVEVLDLERREVSWVSPVPEYTNALDVSPDDRFLAVGGSACVVLDLASGREVGRDAHFGNNIHSVRFSPSADALAVSSYEGKIRIFDTAPPAAALRLRKVLRHTGTANVYALAFAEGGAELVSSSGDKTVRIWSE
jgi:WD40 repeat protein